MGGVLYISYAGYIVALALAFIVEGHIKDAMGQTCSGFFGVTTPCPEIALLRAMIMTGGVMAATPIHFVFLILLIAGWIEERRFSRGT